MERKRKEDQNKVEITSDMKKVGVIVEDAGDSQIEVY